MVTATAFIPRPAEACFRVFTNPGILAAWVPGLRRARVIAVDAAGLPTEILFEFATSLTYSLVYRYDVAAREVHWEPRVGKRDAVRGRARFEAFDSGTRMTYELELGDARAGAGGATDDARVIVDAFQQWMKHEPP